MGTIVFEVCGTNVATAYIVSPPTPRGALGISLPFITMLIKNLKRYFTFEIQVSANRKSVNSISLHVKLLHQNINRGVRMIGPWCIPYTNSVTRSIMWAGYFLSGQHSGTQYEIKGGLLTPNNHNILFINPLQTPTFGKAFILITNTANAIHRHSNLRRTHHNLMELSVLCDEFCYFF